MGHMTLLGAGKPTSSAAPTAIFTSVGLGHSDSGFGGGSVRNKITISSGSLGRVRATFKAGTGANLVIAHAAIGIFSSGTTVTTATPLELLFSGVSGCTIPTSTTLTSDYVTLAFTGSDKLVVIIDITSGSIADNRTNETNSILMFQIPGATYNQTGEAGMTGPTANWNYGVVSIETSV